MAITRRCNTFASNKVVQLYIVVGLHYILVTICFARGQFSYRGSHNDCLCIVCASECVLKH